jgi:protease I
MSLENKKIALFVADMYNEFEFWYPYYRMKEEGADVVVIGPDTVECKSKLGIPVKPDSGITNVKAQDFHALIIPGGYAPDNMRRSKKMVDFVKEMYQQGKVIAAICHAGWMLASADIIDGKKVTSFFSIKDDMVNAGARWVDDEVVVDGKIITSRQPKDLPAFCKTIILLLTK